MVKPTTVALFVAVTAAALTTGCSSFYSRSTSGTTTRTDFDTRMPLALEDVFSHCTNPLTLSPGTSRVDFVGSCTAADTTTAGGDLLLGLLGAAGPIPLSTPIDGTLFSASDTVSGFPWPMQNCEVDLSATVDLSSLKLYNLDAEWRAHSSKPSMHIDFDFQSHAHVVDATIDANVRCPSAINDSVLQAALDAIIPNHAVQIDLTGLDLDLDVMLAVSGGRISGTLDTQVAIGGVDIHSTITDIANLLGLSDNAIMGAFGLDVSTLGSTVEPMLNDALASLPSQVASYLQMGVPAGQSVTAVSIVTSGGANALRISSH